jgi:hypothetical protein
MEQGKITLRRYSGKFTQKELNSIINSFRKHSRFNDNSCQIATKFFVQGQLQIDIAEEHKLSRSYINYVCSLVLNEHLRLEKTGKGKHHD